MQILCLDLASRLGWAARDAAGRVTWGAHKLPDTGDDIGWFIHAYDVWLCDMLTLHASTHVVYEAPWVGEKTSQAVARKLMCLAGFTAYRCRRRRVPSKPANNASVRAHFIRQARGKRADLKRMTIQACKLRGWNTDDEDAADALAVLDYEASRLKLDGVIAGPIFCQAEVR